MFCYEPAAWEWSQLLSFRVRPGAFCRVRDKLTKITNKIGKLLDLQTGLFNKGALRDLTAHEVDDYRTRRDSIRQLCSQLSDLHS